MIGDQEFPEVLAVVDLIKAMGGHAAVEAVHGAQGRVFFVGRPAGHAVQLSLGERHQLGEILFPEDPGGPLVAVTEADDPLRDFLADDSHDTAP